MPGQVRKGVGQPRGSHRFRQEPTIPRFLSGNDVAEGEEEQHLRQPIPPQAPSFLKDYPGARHLPFEKEEVPGGTPLSGPLHFLQGG